ncbi:unnamed protein product [Trichogramma brassicae]|uniref:Reverse transcriptase domain-containing protein n=1 Tax=Trichogramma brassicae TaxID=86971 RepID=A0A6H5I3V0_9HYME|nr:unnamed protein product [Trichogramma brassicae]
MAAPSPRIDMEVRCVGKFICDAARCVISALTDRSCPLVVTRCTLAAASRTSKPTRVLAPVQQSRPSARQPTHSRYQQSDSHHHQPSRPRQRKVRLRPDAIVVKAAGTTTYADILRKLYAEPALQKTVVKSVQCIRRSTSGALVLQLRKGVQNASALGTELDGVLGDAATASALRHKTALEIRDLDECTTKAEICTALGHQLGTTNLDPDVVRSLRKAYAGTQTAVIDLPDELAAETLKLGYLRVGWVSCRVRERAEASRCFRCWEFDHVAARCAGPDRLKLCYRVRMPAATLPSALAALWPRSSSAANTMRILQLNLNHCRSAQNLLSQTVRELGINVAIVCDQYKNPGPHYTWIADSNRQAAIWVRGGLPVQDRPSRPLPFFTWARVSDVYIFSVYAPPRLSNAEFSALLANVVEEAQHQRPLIIAGDFNAWSTEWGSSETKPRGVALLDALSALNVVLLNTGHTPTFTGPQGSSIIDLSFASDSLTPRVAGWQVEREVFTNSDHRAITFNLSAHRPHRSSAGPRRRWCARKLDVEAFSERLSRARIPNANATPGHPEDMAAALITAITEACSVSMPSGGGRRRHHEPVYWWTDEIAALWRQCLRARRLAQRARGRAAEEARLADFAIAKSRLRAAIEESKRPCWSAICNEVDRDVLGRPYGTVMSRLRGPRATPPREPTLVRRTVAALFPTVTEALIRPGVTLEELRGACTRIRDGAAPGPDGVPNRALKLAVVLRPDAFLRVYSTCLSGGVFPSPWKRQRLVLLSKPGRPPDAPSSYRPLCMLDTAGKILERIICRRLEGYTEAPDGLSDHQHGFRRGRSTVDAIESVTTAAREAVGGARGSRKYCAVVTLDVRNAFNSARWNNILAALERIRTPEYLQKIIYSYFQARVLEYDTDDGPESCSISAGVPQGSVLGPILWNVMYDSILRLRLDDGVRIVGFADDIAVVTVAGTTYEVEDLLSRAIARVRDALWGLGLETADHKTEALLFSRKRRLETITIEVGDCFIASSPCIHDLGIQLDARLTFNDHLIAASEKASKVAGALSQIMSTIGGSRSSRRRLYANVINSILLYGTPIWSCGPGARAGLRRAEAIHRRACLRVISGRPHLSYDAAYVLASIPPLALLADERSRLHQRHHEDARTEEGQETLRRWQSQWDRSPKGRWTHRLIPNIRSWIERRYGEVDYHLTQLLSGHGYFKHHSQRYDHNASADCPACPLTVENAEHVFFNCPRFEEGREKLHRQLQEASIMFYKQNVERHVFRIPFSSWLLD